MPSGHLRHPSLPARKTTAAILFLFMAVVTAPASAPPPLEPQSSLEILLRPGNETTPATIVITGLPSAALVAIREAALTDDEWTTWLRISTATDRQSAWSQLAVLGTFSVSATTVHFTPLFGFDPGRSYWVSVDPSRLPRRLDSVENARRIHAIDRTVERPATRTPRPRARVLEVYPTATTVPENLLRWYIHFSSPMGWTGGRDRVHLLDGDGQVIEDAFLPLDLPLWNEDRTRYTVLFDPGRVKRGILPNELMGRPLTAGRTYTLVIDQSWLDAEGRPLGTRFARQFFVGPPEHRAIDPREWNISVPAAGTRRPVIVSLTRPLDHGLLQRAVLLTTAHGVRVDGVTAIDEFETRWAFTPEAPWTTQQYRVAVLPMLEDPSGNRVGRPFETATSPRRRRSERQSEVDLLFVPTGHPR